MIRAVTLLALVFALALTGCRMSTAPHNDSARLAHAVSAVPDPVIEPSSGSSDPIRIFIGAAVAAPHSIAFAGHRSGSSVSVEVSGVTGHGAYQQPGGWHLTATLYPAGARRWLVSEGDVAGYAENSGVRSPRVIDLNTSPDFTSPSVATIANDDESASLTFPAAYLAAGSLAFVEIHDIDESGVDHGPPIGRFVRP